MSLSSNRFVRLASSGDYNAAIAGYKDYMISHCANPQRVCIRDSHTGKPRFIQVPCGSCYHCCESKVNEWVTRMYAHCEDYPYVYFITLTYASFYRVSSDVTKLMLSKLGDAVWHYDNRNSLGKLCWRPTLLIKRHYQNFLKRLRKNTNNNSLTYVLCGEYGKRFGAPHFHAILFSKVPISHADVKRAWSVSFWYSDSGKWSYRTSQRNNGKSYDVLIGRTDFNDLVSNGTFNTAARIKVDNNFMSASHCFSYVCKYVCKRDNANYCRVLLAYRSLFKIQSFVKKWYGSDEVSYNDAKADLRTLSECHVDISQLNNFLKQNSYEKSVFQPCSSVYSSGLCQFKKLSVCGADFFVEIFPEKYYDFRDLYSPFVEFSRGTPIGSLYAKNHLYEFVNGVFRNPLLQNKGFIVPRYFMRKADEYVYGVRKIRKTIKSVSSVLGCLPSLSSDLFSCLNGQSVFSDCVRSLRSFASIGQVLNSSYAYKDLFSGERFFVKFRSVYFYKYDKHLRKYNFVRKVSVHDFFWSWYSRLNKEFERYNIKVANSKSSMRDFEVAMTCISNYIDPLVLYDNFVSEQKQFLKTQQKTYDDTHASLE